MVIPIATHYERWSDVPDYHQSPCTELNSLRAKEDTMEAIFFKFCLTRQLNAQLGVSKSCMFFTQMAVARPVSVC